MKRAKQNELILQLTDKELTYHLVVTQIVLLTISVFSGILLFKDISTFFELFRLDSSVYIYGVSSGVAVVLLDLIFMKVLPNYYYDDGGINNKIFANRSVVGIAFLAFIIAVCEELLFRGVIQFHFGLIIASIIFAIIHIRYWGHWFLIINILILSFWIGIVFELTNHNLTATIVMHFIIDFLLGVSIKFKQRF